MTRFAPDSLTNESLWVNMNAWNREKVKRKMALYINLADYGPAVGCTRNTAAKRLRNVPHIGERNQRFALSQVLPELRDHTHAAPLLAVARSDGEFFVGGDEVLPTARKLETWLQADPAMGERLHFVRVTFFNALASMKSATLFRDSERLRLALPLSEHVQPYILTGDRRGLPFMGSYARAFALVHQGAPLDCEIIAPEGLHEIMRGYAA